MLERLSFKLMWLASSARLRLLADRTRHELPPIGACAATHYSVVARLPTNIASSVTEALQRLHERDPRHYYYPSDTMHVTILVLDGFLSAAGGADALLAELRAMVGSHPSFDLTLRGLNLSPATVFAQVTPHDRTLGRLRRDLRRLARQSNPWSRARGVGVVVRDLLPHANVVRFSGRVRKDFLDEVSRSRQLYFGQWTVREVEIVRTDRLLSQEGTRVLERVPLATT